MKTKIIKSLIYSLITTVLVQGISLEKAGALGGGGFGPGNGGDVVALEFTALGRALDTHWNDFAGSDFPISQEKFKQILDQTRVVTVDQTILQGSEVDAINYPEAKLIEVSRARWTVQADLSARTALVLHEYLLVGGVADDHYQFSGPALKKLAPVLSVQVNQNFVCAIQNRDSHIMGGPITLDVMDTLTPPTHRLGRARYLRRFDDPTSPVNNYVIDFNIQPPFASADGKSHLFFAVFYDPTHSLVLREPIAGWNEVLFSSSAGKTMVSLVADPAITMTCYQISGSGKP